MYSVSIYADTNCAEYDFVLAEFITPGTTEQRMADTCQDARGFIYCVSNNGVTGVKKVDYSVIGGVCEKARKFTDTPLAVGFGIGSAEAAVAAAAHADAVIVGSAVVKRLLDGQLPEAMQLIHHMRDALDATTIRPYAFDLRYHLHQLPRYGNP